MTEKKYRIECALDEIDACYDLLESAPKPGQSEEIKKVVHSCVRKQKAILSEYKYTGKLRKLRRGCA